MNPEETIKDKNYLIHKLSDTASKLEKGELSFIFFEMSETPGPSYSKGRLILQYQNILWPGELSGEARQAVEAIKNLVSALNQGANISNFREEFDPVKGVDYSGLAESDEYGGYQRIVVEWEKRTRAG